MISFLLVTIILTGCGGDAAGSVAVQIDTHTITSAQVDHWMSVIAAGASTAPGQPTARPPDPPGYVSCIAYLRAYAPWAKPGDGRPAVTSGRLRAQCEYEYEKLKLKALYALISNVWVAGEAGELGVKATPGELRHALVQLKSGFPNEQAFKKFMEVRGLTLADLLDETTQGVLVELIQQKLEQEGDLQHLTTAQRQQRLDQFGRRYEAKWKSRTDCRQGYLVPICERYHLATVPFGLVPNALPLTDLAAT